jgi:hypothetical protein
MRYRPSISLKFTSSVGDPIIYETKPVAIAGCAGRGPGSEDCHFRAMWNSAECYPGHPCERLVVYWAGGNQTCDDVDKNNQGDFDPLLSNYVDRGFIAAAWLLENDW